MNRHFYLIISLILIGCFYIGGVYSNADADTESPSIQIEDCEQLELYVGTINKTLLKCTFTPSDYVDEVKSWSSDNESVVMIASGKVIVPVGVGSATITVETVNGLKDTIEIVVKEGSTIAEGDIVESSNDRGKQSVVLNRFVPTKSGTYEIGLVEYDVINERYNIMVYEEGKYSPIKNGTVSTSKIKTIQFELESGKVYHLGTYLTNASGETNHSYSINYLTPSPAPEPTAVPDTIVKGEIKEIAVTETGQVNRYMFVPDETGIYKFYSKGYNNVYGEVRNNEGSLLDRSDNLEYYYGYYRYQGNFAIEYKFIAGEVYYLDSILTGSSSENYSVGIEKLAVATGVDIASRDETELKYGMEQQLNLNFTPKDARDTVISWISDNPEIVAVSGSGKMSGKAIGSVNVTVTTETGLTDTIKVTVVDHEEIYADEKKSHWSVGGKYYYKFIPNETGIYKFVMDCDSNSYSMTTSLFDSDFKYIDAWNTYNDGPAEVLLNSGTAYYISFEAHTDCIAEGAYLTINKIDDVTAPPTDVPVETATPVPAETEIPEPTDTICPTDTPTPEVTVTPTPTCIYPSDTPEPLETPTPDPTEDIKPTETGNVPVPWEALGDVNIDGDINAEDALLVLKHAAKLEILTGQSLEVADTTEDGHVDAEDALKILKKAAKLIEEL